MPGAAVDVFVRSLREKKLVSCYYDGSYREFSVREIGYRNGHPEALALDVSSRARVAPASVGAPCRVDIERALDAVLREAPQPAPELPKQAPKQLSAQPAPVVPPYAAVDDVVVGMIADFMAPVAMPFDPEIDAESEFTLGPM